MWRRQESFFEVYIEAQADSSEDHALGYQESCAIKLSYPNVYQPQLAIGAIRRVRNVAEVIDLGEFNDGENRRMRVVKVLSRASANLELLKKDIIGAMSVGRGSHL